MKYSRQDKILEKIDEKFKDKIKAKTITVIGCGGVGSVLCELLVRGGFLNLNLVDLDVVDETNLQRQTYFEEDLEKPKVKALKEKLEKINPKSNISIFLDKVEKNNIDKFCNNTNLIIDATDSFQTRIIINNYCEEKGIDWIYNGAIKTELVTCTFYSKDKLFKKVFPSKLKEEVACDVGVLASTTYACASLSYNQVLKYFLNIKENKMIKIDLWKNTFHEVKLK